MHKIATIDHIIATLHMLRAKYDNEVSLLPGGDFNRVNINPSLTPMGVSGSVLQFPQGRRQY